MYDGLTKGFPTHLNVTEQGHIFVLGPLTFKGVSVRGKQGPCVCLGVLESKPSLKFPITSIGDDTSLAVSNKVLP